MKGKPSYLTLSLGWRSLWHWVHFLCKTWMQYCIIWWSSCLQRLLGKERGVSPALGDFERCVVLNGSCHCWGQTWALMSWVPAFLCSAVHFAAVNVFSTDLTNIHPYIIQLFSWDPWMLKKYISVIIYPHTHTSFQLFANEYHTCNIDLKHIIAY